MHYVRIAVHVRIDPWTFSVIADLLLSQFYIAKQVTQTVRTLALKQGGAA